MQVAAVSAVKEDAEATQASRVADTIADTVAKFASCADAKQRYQLVLQYADSLPELPEDLKTNANRVLGCTAQVG
jgi:sulfur transfer protein SufE